MSATERLNNSGMCAGARVCMCVRVGLGGACVCVGGGVGGCGCGDEYGEM